MNPRWAMVWIFVCGASISALLAIPLGTRLGITPDVAGAYLRDVGTVYAGPLGIMIPAVFTRRAPFGSLGGNQVTLAMVVSLAWNVVPTALGLYGAFAPHPEHFESLLNSFSAAAIPLNGVLVAILAALFPKDANQGSIPAAVGGSSD